MKPATPTLKTDAEKTKVIFRIWPKSQGGDVIALFPQEPGTNQVMTCLSYQHTGQHGAASVDLGRELRLATPEEYADLQRELIGLGYNLDVRKKVTHNDYKIRKAKLNHSAAT